MRKRNLQGLSLSVVYISRKGIEGTDMAYVCENCGQTIINYAVVMDSDQEEYIIGLDCKKQLIDKPAIDAALLEDAIFGKQNAKEIRQKASDAEKILVLSSDPGNKMEIDGSDLIITDDKPHKLIEGLTGNIVFLQPLGYVFSIGLKLTIEAMIKSGRITYRR